ncbi:transcription factor A, mitochondrial [Schistocerca americana]|uniref:transcription factor A, mitochondrial n=1 Tax=Schistocerca americana TaxID=7009 RepID=UPI001F4FF793|nr:transcription factor A, mitochondrial [Schistocerca americana]XP_046990465.1 transcription factor A, mitochondrial [Schistocerca americana]XP_046990466.1 transcription factor A, mitochondrial [Schistocerca americana]XP_047108453.1 transcription factor A, mitochondrial [Schistocerca piceifrons]XP_047108454.1 transcription factor A, mitochondrial [Schistocerca piceifrons]XP_049949438.1 transcription factor A, mitochondrial [Schistocerca serialis cubense]XP_049949439.1 transcription factor A,
MRLGADMMRIGNLAFKQFRNVLLPRHSLGSFPADQPSCGLKQSVEEKLGLPPRPKKPLTPYFRFMQQIRPSIIQKNPQAKATDIVKMVAAEWEKADQGVRDSLQRKFHEEMMEYAEEYTHYQNKLTDKQRQALREAKDQKVREKRKKLIQKKMQEMGKPKRPMTGFVRFMYEQKDKRGSLPFREWQAKVAEEWQQLPDNEKEEYSKKSQRDLADYQERLQEWEERMIRLGHIDIVRKEALIESRDSSRGTLRHRSHTRE